MENLTPEEAHRRAVVLQYWKNLMEILEGAGTWPPSNGQPMLDKETIERFPDYIQEVLEYVNQDQNTLDVQACAECMTRMLIRISEEAKMPELVPMMAAHFQVLQNVLKQEPEKPASSE